MIYFKVAWLLCFVAVSTVRKETIMAVSYQKLFNLMRDKKMKRKDLIERAGISYANGLIMKLFALGNSTTPSTGSYYATTTKIYSATFIKDDVVVRDYIPVLDNLNKPAMYDKISQQPFYNKGTGEFGYELMDGTYVAPQ